MSERNTEIALKHGMRMKFFVVGFFVMGAVFGSKRNQTHVSSETSLKCDATSEYVWNRKYPSTWYGLSVIEKHGSDLFGQGTRGLVDPTESNYLARISAYRHRRHTPGFSLI